MDKNPLAVLSSLTKAEKIGIHSSPFDIGRNKSAKLIVPNVHISRNHCLLIHCKDQSWIIKDLSSSGTYLNGQLVGKGNSKALKDNDIIRVGPDTNKWIWKFTTNVGKVLGKVQPTGSKCDVMAPQSQVIIDLCNEKDTLQKQIIHNRESCLKMKLEKEELHQKCLTQTSSDKRFSDTNVKLSVKPSDPQTSFCKEVTKEQEEEEKNKKLTEKKLADLEKRIIENDKKEEELKLQVEKLQKKLAQEQTQWENKFLKEKKKLEEKINEQNQKLAVEKVKVEKISIAHGQIIEKMLRKEEEEKKKLMGKLQEMEESKKILSQKLKESDELHLLDKARIEEEMQKELLKKEEDMKALLEQHTSCLQRDQIPAGTSQIDQKEIMGNEELRRELDEVKNTLMESESRQKLLEKELAEMSSLKDQESKAKSDVLENITDMMETELQCSICSELFVNAITLNCTHTFCKHCIDLWKKKKKSCPICRKKITSENRSIVMDNYIDRMVENLSDELKNRRRALIEERVGVKPCKISRIASPSVSTAGRQTTSAAPRRMV